MKTITVLEQDQGNKLSSVISELDKYGDLIIAHTGQNFITS